MVVEGVGKYVEVQGSGEQWHKSGFEGGAVMR